MTLRIRCAACSQEIISDCGEQLLLFLHLPHDRASEKTDFCSEGCRSTSSFREIGPEGAHEVFTPLFPDIPFREAAE
jgi:hypothetical protein